jgi:hypothetical protein
MSNIEVRAIEKARDDLKRAQKEYQRAKLRDTHYRGVSTVIFPEEPQEVHGTFVYRGIEYTK